MEAIITGVAVGVIMAAVNTAIAAIIGARRKDKKETEQLADNARRVTALEDKAEETREIARLTLGTCIILGDGMVQHGITIDESIPFDPDHAMGDYDKSKARASQLVVQAAGDGLNAVIVCPTGVIGPYDYNFSEMGTLIGSMLHTPVAFSVRGSYDFVDVRDVAHGLVMAAEKGAPGSIYILSGEYIAISEILRTASGALGRKTPIINVPFPLAKIAARVSPAYCRLTHRKAHLTPYSLSTIQSNAIVTHRKATQELGYSPRCIRDSVRDLIYWLREKSPAT